MCDKITNAIVLSYALFGSVYLFNASFKRLTELNNVQPRLLQFLDGFILGSTGYFIMLVNIKAFNLIK